MEEKLDRYIASVIDPEPEYLHQLLRNSYLETLAGRMNSGHIQGRLLKMLIRLAGARNVLELGTFCGYSALCLAEGVGECGKVTTIEIDDEREDFIREHFNRSGLSDRLHLIIGDCLGVMKKMPPESFDAVFMDADKRKYPDYLPEAIRLLKKGGMLIADNTLWDSHVIDPEYDSDPQTRGILSFNRMLADNPALEKVIIPVRDGLTVALKL